MAPTVSHARDAMSGNTASAWGSLSKKRRRRIFIWCARIASAVKKKRNAPSFHPSSSALAVLHRRLQRLMQPTGRSGKAWTTVPLLRQRSSNKSLYLAHPKSVTVHLHHGFRISARSRWSDKYLSSGIYLRQMVLKNQCRQAPVLPRLNVVHCLS